MSGLRRAAYVPEDEREKRVIELASTLKPLPWRPEPVASLDHAAARELLRELEAARPHAEAFTRVAGWSYEDALDQLVHQGRFKGRALGLLVDLAEPVGFLTTVRVEFGVGDPGLHPPDRHTDGAVVDQGNAVYALARKLLPLPRRCRGATWFIDADKADVIEGSCLGLTLFATIYAAAYGMTLPEDWAWTGSFDGGRVQPVEHLALKIEAAARSGVRTIVLAPPSPEATAEATSRGLTLIGVETTHDVIEALRSLRPAPPPSPPPPAPGATAPPSTPPPPAPDATAPPSSPPRSARGATAPPSTPPRPARAALRPALWLALVACPLLLAWTGAQRSANGTSPIRPVEPVIVALRELEPPPLAHACAVDLVARGVSADRAGWICVLRRAAEEGARGVVLGLQLVDHGPRPWTAGADLSALSNAITALHAARVPLYAVANADGGLLRRCPSDTSCATALLEDDVLPARPVHVGEPCVTGTPTLAFGIAVLHAGAPDLVDVCLAAPVPLPSLPAARDQRPWVTTTIGALLGDHAPGRDPLRPEDALAPPPARLTDRVLVIGAQVWPGHPHALQVTATDGAPRSLAPAELHAWIGANLVLPDHRGAR